MSIQRTARVSFARASSYVLVSAFLCILGTTNRAEAETFEGSVADTRMTLAFSVAKAAAQDWLPAPWKVSPLPHGPFKGANLLVVSVDRLLHQDAKGTPNAGGSYRMVVLVVPAENSSTGQKAPFVARIYATYSGAGPYKNSVKTTVRRQTALAGTSLGPDNGTEEWAVRDSDGRVLEIRVEYQRAVPKRVRKEIKPRSAVEPDFFRIYRQEQLIDIVKSVPGGIDRVSGYEFRATIPELDAMFDGTEELVGIAVIPWYTRQTFLP